MGNMTGEFRLNATTTAEHIGDGIFHIWQDDGEGHKEFVVFNLKDAEALQRAALA